MTTRSLDDETVAGLFERLRQGDATAQEALVGALYADLHAIAARHMRGEARQHTLQATALVHETYIRLLTGPTRINDRNHFFALAATAMRRALVDHARAKRSDKRGGKLERVALDGLPDDVFDVVDVLDFDKALTSLAEVNPRAARIVELRFFGGHTDKEVCELMGLTHSMVRRDWADARAWLTPRLEAYRPD